MNARSVEVSVATNDTEKTHRGSNFSRMGKLTGWLGTIISKAVRALAARLVQRQRIFVTTPWLCLLVLCLFG
jgi:hypothetical protein